MDIRFFYYESLIKYFFNFDREHQKCTFTIVTGVTTHSLDITTRAENEKALKCIGLISENSHRKMHTTYL